jgi:thioredoxin 1
MESFNEIINGDQPVLVDFFATWCGPCRAMTPIVEELGKELEGKARVLKVDIDKNESVSNSYQIQTVPTFIVFKQGKVLWRHSGMTDKNALLEQVKSFI